MEYPNSFNLIAGVLVGSVALILMRSSQDLADVRTLKRGWWRLGLLAGLLAGIIFTAGAPAETLVPLSAFPLPVALWAFVLYEDREGLRALRIRVARRLERDRIRRRSKKLHD